MNIIQTLDFDQLNRRIADQTLARNQWTGTDAQGRATACLLAALYPPCGETKQTDTCPASLMQPWLAYLTVWIDDSGTNEAWPAHIQRYAAVIRDVTSLDPEKDQRLSLTIRSIIVKEALSHVTTDNWGVRAACEAMIVALDLGYKEKLEAAARAARAAARAAEWAAAGAAAEDRMIDAILSALENSVKTV